MRKVKLSGLVYKEEVVSLPDEFDKIYDRLIEIDNKHYSEVTLKEDVEREKLAGKMWDEVRNGYYSSDFTELIRLESEDGDHIIWEN